ncbi:uncharacterized protein LOC128229333 isoform X1 [Mya arenaria]|uniref:uncharacterized protein LOC128229333 isoform X1 n=1 Tax=Mya arenaria TaxID=6604 RepID=UPI0022E45455|nr:uncharacterized protein LOC128229333 isoform X1 [Mya arenaria]
MFHLLLLSAIIGGIEAAPVAPSPCTLSNVFSYTQTGTVTFMASGSFNIVDQKQLIDYDYTRKLQRVIVEAETKDVLRIIYMDFANKMEYTQQGINGTCRGVANNATMQPPTILGTATVGPKMVVGKDQKSLVIQYYTYMWEGMRYSVGVNDDCILVTVELRQSVPGGFANLIDFVISDWKNELRTPTAVDIPAKCKVIVTTIFILFSVIIF